MKKPVLLAIVVVAAVIATVIYTTIGAGNKRFRCEVCMEFQQRSACRRASAATEQQAFRTAKENACAQIASGVTDTVQCEQYTAPASVRWLAGK